MGMMRVADAIPQASQINRENVSQLKLAWTYRTGAMDRQTDLNHKAAFEATPILIDGKLFLSTPYDHVIALDPVSGKKIWSSIQTGSEHGYSEVTSRGVSAWRDASAKAGQLCALRIFIGTLDARLIALDGKWAHRVPILEPPGRLISRETSSCAM